jgi:hypothetical protein
MNAGGGGIYFDASGAIPNYARNSVLRIKGPNAEISYNSMTEGKGSGVFRGLADNVDMTLTFMEGASSSNVHHNSGGSDQIFPWP